MPEEHRGKYRFAKQIGGWGSFADVEVIVDSSNPGSARIDVAGLSDDPRRDDWVAGLHLGVRYALEHVPGSQLDVSVRVAYLHTNPVDSSTLSVAFATCFAVWDAVGHSPEAPPYFDDAGKSFVFPR